MKAAVLESQLKKETNSAVGTLRRMEILDKLPCIDRINRRSKRSFFKKIIHGGQAAWFMANVISRLAGALQVTLFEDVTIAYTLCGLVSAIAWQDCPQDLEDGFDIEIPKDLWGKHLDGSRQEDLDSVLAKSVLIRVIAYGMLAAFAGVHLASWKYPFFSTAEAWIWRSGAVETRVFGVLVLRFGDLSNYGKTRHWSLAIAGPGYFSARLALIVISLAAFQQMPASAI